MRGRLLFFIACAAAAAAIPAIHAQITLGDDEETVACTNDTACTDEFGESAFCDESSHCTCKNDTVFHPEQRKCVEEITSFKSATKCVTDSDCFSIEDAICRFGNCTCNNNYIKSTDQKRCLQLANEVGWGCDEDIQCTTNLNKTTECRENQCLCKSGTTLNQQGACVEHKGLEAFCSTSAVCTTEHSECLQGVCACRDGFVADSTSKRCLEVAQGYKSPCDENKQCTEAFGNYAECNKKECTCTTDHHFSDMHCWEDRGLTQRCDRPDECHIAQDGANQKLQCIAGQCICKPEYVADLGTLRCSGAATTTISGLSLALLAVLLFA